VGMDYAKSPPMLPFLFENCKIKVLLISELYMPTFRNTLSVPSS